jgi:hypothetical protein
MSSIIDHAKIPYSQIEFQPFGNALFYEIDDQRVLPQHAIVGLDSTNDWQHNAGDRQCNECQVLVLQWFVTRRLFDTSLAPPHLSAISRGDQRDEHIFCKFFFTLDQIDQTCPSTGDYYS